MVDELQYEPYCQSVPLYLWRRGTVEYDLILGGAVAWDHCLHALLGFAHPPHPLQAPFWCTGLHGHNDNRQCVRCVEWRNWERAVCGPVAHGVRQGTIHRCLPYRRPFNPRTGQRYLDLSQVVVKTEPRQPHLWPPRLAPGLLQEHIKMPRDNRQ